MTVVETLHVFGKQDIFLRTRLIAIKVNFLPIKPLGLSLVAWLNFIKVKNIKN